MTENFYDIALYSSKSLVAYKNFVKNLPILSEEEELELVKNYKDNHCLQSAQKLVLSQLKTVLRIAEDHKGYGLPEEDLIQEGTIGLMKAVKNFDLKYKVRLYTYAIIWIKSEIQSFILKNWKIVKIATTKNLKKLFFNFKSTQKELIDLGVPKHKMSQKISEKLNVSLEDTQDMQSYFGSEDFIIEEEKEDGYVFQLPYEKTPEIEYEVKHDQQVLENKLKDNIEKLNDKQKLVIQLRFFNENKQTHKEIAKLLNISSERVRQIEQEALLKLKNLIL